jgi:hypothetical protein
VSAPPREYLDAAQLAARAPWSVEAIRRMVSRGVLRRGVHYFQPLGPRTQLIFKWSAIVALIEGGPVVAVPAGERGRPDVEAATAALHRLLS